MPIKGPFKPKPLLDSIKLGITRNCSAQLPHRWGWQSIQTFSCSFQVCDAGPASVLATEQRAWLYFHHLFCLQRSQAGGILDVTPEPSLPQICCVVFQAGL